ncbi:hypothetical protein CRG98_005202 [Punica granatum]|uniref:Uncharacterized protein n=1 Tax=Punica granatum TaxID=22663 RepID=A0A2I0L142_PUNGR|nr:hypothetical protein CRG98_005202 [Punica granatum]
MTISVSSQWLWDPTLLVLPEPIPEKCTGPFNRIFRRPGSTAHYRADTYAGQAPMAWHRIGQSDRTAVVPSGQFTAGAHGHVASSDWLRMCSGRYI